MSSIKEVLQHVARSRNEMADMLAKEGAPSDASFI